jgi:hypothetical protein
MIFLIAEKEGVLQHFQWTTCDNSKTNEQIYDALISCTWQSANHTFGLISHPEINTDFFNRMEQESTNRQITQIMIISRDQAHQSSLQKLLTGLRSKAIVNNIMLATHQDLYRSGLTKVNWQNPFGQRVDFSSIVIDPSASAKTWESDFGTISAA